jgi:hypothetical protein
VVLWSQQLKHLLKNIIVKKKFAENVMQDFQSKQLIVEKENVGIQIS